MQAYYQEILPPSGVEHAATLNFTPSSRERSPPASTSNSDVRVITNLVTARNNYLRIYEVREESALLPSLVEDERKHALNNGGGTRSRRGTEAVEGEVAMDEHGDGWVNFGAMKPVAEGVSSPTVTRLRLVREHRLHGTVTGLGRIQTLSTIEDGLDRLVISFKDAKIAVVEWSDAIHDISTVSIHSYERSAQVMSPNAALHRPILRIDPLYRCMVLLLPEDSVAVLPFYQAQVDLDIMDQDGGKAVIAREIPFSPSFILPFANVDDRIRNVVDLSFLPGFNSPTMAVLFQSVQTWTGRLKEFKDVSTLFILTLDLLTQSYPIFSSSVNLPYDAFSITPVPPALGGGVIVLTSNSIIHVESSGSGRKIVCPVNGWAERVSDSASALAKSTLATGESVLSIEDSYITFPLGAAFGLLFLPSGAIYKLMLVIEGRSVTKITLETDSPLGKGTIPSVVLNVATAEKQLIFVGSTAGASSLIQIGYDMTKSAQAEANGYESKGQGVNAREADMDLDDDIYGDSKPSTFVNGTHTNGVGANDSSVVDLSKARVVLHLSDTIAERGVVSDMAFRIATNGDKPVAELVASTASGAAGGFTFFQQTLPTRTRRKLNVMSGAKGIWEIPLKQPPKHANVHGKCSSVILSADATPTPGVSRIAARSAKSDLVILNRTSLVTVGAGPFFQGTAIAQVTANSVRLLEPDGVERQTIKDMDGPLARANIRACSISDPFILILREDNTLGLYIGESEKGRMRRKDMSAMGDKSSRYLWATFYSDKSGIFKANLNPDYRPPSATSNKRSAVTSSLEAATDANRGTQWLALVRPQGVLEIWTLPRLSLAFSCSYLPTLTSPLLDGFEGPTASLPGDGPRTPLDTDVEQLMIHNIGEANDHPCLTVLLRSGHLAIYEFVPTEPDLSTPVPPHREFTLQVQLFKLKSTVLPHDFSSSTVLGDGVQNATRRSVAERIFYPFTVTMRSLDGPSSYAGIFLSGDSPMWILGTDKGGVRVHKCQHSTVYAFSACTTWSTNELAQFLMYTEEGPILAEWIPEYSLEGVLPSRTLPLRQSFSHVKNDTTTGLLVVAALVPSRFCLFDEDGEKVWEPDNPNLTEPYQHCSSLELISPEDGFIIDGYEFAWNEFVNSLEIVSLETTSSETGEKEYIACGTSINRGEDLAVRGCTYVFEITETVPESDEDIGHHFRLRLLCKDESKGPVSVVTSLNGYLVSSMGQKIFVRAFELDERLVGVAFLDVGIYVTAITVLKNLLLLGDVNRGTMFVGFQEDPFKLIVLSRDVRSICALTANFVYGSGEMGIVIRDEQGILRTLAFDPYDPDTIAGQQLIPMSEFNTGVEPTCSITSIRRFVNVDDEMAATGEDGNPMLKVIWGNVDGSMTALIPIPMYSSEDDMGVPDEILGTISGEKYKRLHLLEGRLLRGVVHTAGLNPRAFRAVPIGNQFKSAKNILDGGLLQVFFDLEVERQDQLCVEIGARRSDVIRDLLELNAGGPGPLYQGW